MPEVAFLAVLFVVAFVTNVAWEFLHARLYTVWQTMPRGKLTRLLLWQSLKDAFWILCAYLLVPNLYGFAALLLVFSWSVERHAITIKRWEYTAKMPLVFGVGLSPLLELAVTGVFAVGVVTLLGT